MYDPYAAKECYFCGFTHEPSYTSVDCGDGYGGCKEENTENCIKHMAQLIRELQQRLQEKDDAE